MVEAVFATVDHSDIRGSKPHNRDPSGAASDYKRGFGPKTYRIELFEDSPFRVPLDHYPRCLLCASDFKPIHFKPPAVGAPSALFLLLSRWPK